MSPSADEANNNNEEEAELPPLQDIINYNYHHVRTGLVLRCTFIITCSFLAPQRSFEASSAL